MSTYITAASMDNDELVRLRAVVEEERSRREEAERRIEEERRGREEERRGREEAERRAEEERRGREEERRGREEAEKVINPQPLQPYLEASHLLVLGINVVTDKKLTTRGDTTKPAGRLYPRRIIPWDDFQTLQEEIWNKISVGTRFCSEPLFPSVGDFQSIENRLQARPITSEKDLEFFHQLTVEDAVLKLVQAAFDDVQLREHLGLDGYVTFESHTNGTTTSLDNTVGHMTIDESIGTEPTTPPPRRSRSDSQAPAKRRKNVLADRFCLYKKSEGIIVPALAIELKAPHKLTRDQVVAGLTEEIQPERDVINQDSAGFAAASKRLITAVITQLFSYMIDNDLQHGYVCTGETLVFLHIPEDPSIVYYSVCVPGLDVLEDDENRLHRTAAAQAFAFVLQAILAPPPEQTWYQRAKHLNTWAVEFEDVLRDIPESDRKTPKSYSYKGGHWKTDFKRSPIKTRSGKIHSGCRPAKSDHPPQDNDEGEDEDGPPPHSSSRRGRSKRAPTLTDITARDAKQSRRTGGTSGRAEQQMHKGTHMKIGVRPFCTQKCLSGLANGGPMDDECPNMSDHQQQHITPSEFLDLIRAQMARDRGRDADCIPMYLAGSVGALFKIRLSSHGYTLVAKGVEKGHLGRLQHEEKVYDQLRSIQGRYIPVCVGIVNLVLPLYYRGGVHTHLLFLSWAGRPLFTMSSQVDTDSIVAAVGAALGAIHDLRVLHCDAEPRNVLYDANSGNAMIVDFERAEIVNREPLGHLSPNRKRKYNRAQGKQREVDFTAELRSVMGLVEHQIEAVKKERERAAFRYF